MNELIFLYVLVLLACIIYCTIEMIKSDSKVTKGKPLLSGAILLSFACISFIYILYRLAC